MPPAVVPECLGALVDGFDAVLLGAEARVPGASARRLAARARERGTVLVAVVEPWFSGPATANVQLRALSPTWPTFELR